MVWKNKFVLQGRYIHDANAVLWKFTENSELNGALLNSPVNVDYNTWLFNASYSDKFGIYRFAYNASFRYIPTKIKFLDTYAHRNPNIAFTLVNQFDITKQMIASIDLSYSSKMVSWEYWNHLSMVYLFGYGKISSKIIVYKLS